MRLIPRVCIEEESSKSKRSVGEIKRKGGLDEERCVSVREEHRRRLGACSYAFGASTNENIPLHSRNDTVTFGAIRNEYGVQSMSCSRVRSYSPSPYINKTNPCYVTGAQQLSAYILDILQPSKRNRVFYDSRVALVASLIHMLLTASIASWQRVWNSQV